jgi:hypothetical protein
MRPRWVDFSLIALIGLMTIGDGALYLHLRNSFERTAQNPELLYRYGVGRVPTPAPDGYTSKGARIGVATQAKSGWVVRYAAKGCEFCRADELRWGPLSARLQELGYKIVVVVPTSKDEYPNNTQTPVGAAQEVYVNMEWIKAFKLTKTPTLMIFNSDQRLMWSHQGELEQSDSASAIHAVESWRDQNS